jgi:hypothetical protein
MLSHIGNNYCLVSQRFGCFLNHKTRMQCSLAMMIPWNNCFPGFYFIVPFSGDFRREFFYKAVQYGFDIAHNSSVGFKVFVNFRGINVYMKNFR